MRLEITLNSNNHVNIPKSYNHILQGLIYHLLAPALSTLIHDEGYKYGKRNFKLFTFSRLIGRFKNTSSHFQFIPPIKFIISSPKNEILQSVAERTLKSERLLLGENEVYLESIAAFSKISKSKEIKIKMLSPVTVYSTLNKSDGAKKTYYYSPFEKEFNELIRENLRKKYELIYGKKTDKIDFNIEPFRVAPSDEKIIIYGKPTARQSKPTIIKAWMGIYKINGDPEIIQIAYDSGIGSKNSQGFGCFEELDEKGMKE